MTITLKGFADASVNDLLHGYSCGEICPEQVIDLTLAQIVAVNSTMHALYDVSFEHSRTLAAKSAERWRKGRPKGLLDGVPVTIKDSVDCLDFHWFHGSAAYGEGITCHQDAPPAARLREAGAIIVGKCTMPDFGLTASGMSSSHGIVRNPWDGEWSTGGSSAGGAASLAAGIGSMSLGTDIAGSVRLPASHCGLAALKPTQGLIPHTPASIVRSAGPMCRQAADLERFTKVLAGPCSADRFSLPEWRPARKNLGQLTVGVAIDFGFGPPVEAVVQEVVSHAVEFLSHRVASVIPIESCFDFDALVPIDDSLKLRGYLEYNGLQETQRTLVPKPLVDWFRPVEAWTVTRIGEFQRGIERVVAQCNHLLEGVDLLLTPVMPLVNFPANQRGIDSGMPLRHATFTAPFNQSGQPAVAFRGGFDSRGLPIGLQLVGRRFDDLTLLRVAAEMESDLFDEYCWPIRPVLSSS